MDAHEQFKQTLGDADNEYMAIAVIAKDIEALRAQYGITGNAENPYTSIIVEVSVQLVIVVPLYMFQGDMLCRICPS